MPSDRDYYHVLGIDERATDAEVRAAYRRAARSNHPDTNPHDPLAGERMRIVQQAYEVLGAPARRTVYRRPGTPASPAPSRRAVLHEKPPRAPGQRTDLSPEVAEVFIALGALARRAKLQARVRRFVRYLERL